ncbi:MAG: glycosyltransferase family 4 protein [Chloroflexota bacterium]
MRVAMLSATPVDTHGWGRYTRDLIMALAEQGAKIDLITSIDADSDPNLPLSSYSRILPSLVPARRYTSLRLLAAMPAVSRHIAHADVVHVIAEPYVLAVPPTHRTIVTAHGTYLPLTVQRRGFGALYRQAYRRSTVICVSRYTQSAVLAAVPGLDTTVITNGVDVARFQQLGTPPIKRSPVVLAVGQIKPRKGFHVLARAMRLVRQVVPDAEVVFIGDKSDTTYCERILADLAAEEPNLSHAVHFLGRVPDDVLLGWYHAADVFALPAVNIGNQFEGFGLVYLEASAAGLPTVGTYGCGAEDAILDGETGFLIPQNDEAATAGAIIKLLQDSALRSRMGMRGIEYAREHGWDKIAQRVREVYETYG